MAILTDVPGLVVTLDVADQDLPEYDDHDAEETPPHTATKYVEVHSGAHFGVARRYTSTTFPHSDDYIKTELWMDGKRICNSTDSPYTIARGQRSVMVSLSTTHGDRRYSQKFAFAELDINEGPADKNLWGKLTELGTIGIKCYRTKYAETPPGSQAPPPREKLSKVYSKRAAPFQYAPPPSPPTPPPTLPPTLPPFGGAQKPVLEGDQVPEKNLKGKAISHQAKLTAPVEEPAPLLAGFTPPRDSRHRILIDKQPFATFNFKYRSRAALQALCVIPRTPSPVPLEARPIEELTPDEMRELLRRQREQAKKGPDLVKVKNEIKRERGRAGGDDEDDEDDELEIVEHRRKKMRTSGPSIADEIVDLCEDD
ncbi:hypothetical protein LTR36_005111 [Oleoguttula mirabilis]|uniref:DUF7918 domain-containing protein n=1 Tax=Oleoguttula mirabilis TaxID=1507867 RepID=A0AAV9JW23_9PEZI|nr:hypothetical protein LTR36_005111 [Oleoguttula mirabilis]